MHAYINVLFYLTFIKYIMYSTTYVVSKLVFLNADMINIKV